MDRPPSPAPPHAPADERSRLPGLDGLRGIAVFMVVIYHFSVFYVESPVGVAYRWTAGLGWAGVDLFFVLSGFLITGILLDTRDSPSYYRSFYARRTLRIFPAYYLFLLLVGLHYTLAPASAPGLPEAAPWLSGFAANLRQALWSDWAATPGFTAHLWSLALEEQFYLVWPLVLRYLPRHRVIPATVLMMGGALAIRVAMLATGTDAIPIYVLPVTRMDALAAGAALAALLRAPGGEAWVRARLPAALRLCALATVLLLATAPLKQSWATPVMLTVGYTLLALSFASLVAWVVLHPPRRFLEARPLASLGRVSYGVYLYHPVLVALLPVGITLLDQLARTGLGLLLSVLLAKASWHLVEAPLLRFKDRFRYAPAPVPEGAAVRADLPALAHAGS